jgi:hypothetical protein
MSRRATAFVAVLLAFALGGSTLTNCLAAAATADSKTQMACCKNGHDKCPMHRSSSQSAADCCRHDGQPQPQLTAAEQQPVHAPAIALERIAAVTPHTAIPVAPEWTTSAHYSGRFTSPSPPRTRLSTVLLI